MKIKAYQKPTIRVIEVQHQRNILLAGSQKRATGEKFTWDNDDEEE